MKGLLTSMFIHRIALAAILYLTTLTPSTVFAGVVVEEIEVPNQGTLSVFHMTVTPAPEPVPALKYRMWLKPQDLKPGNSVTEYLKAFPEGGIEGSWRELREKFGEEVDEWYGNEVPISELPLDKVRIAANRFDSRIEQMIRAGAQCRDCDWGWDALNLKGPETITYLLPDLQVMRSVARAIALRTRLAIAEQEYDFAIENLRFNYRLGQDVGQQLFLVSGLVGIAIEGIANTNVIDLIAAPDSPNLYWALSELPSPLVDCRDTIQLEMSLGLRYFPPLMDAETAEHSPTEWARLVGEGIETFSVFDGRTENFIEAATSQELLATGLSLVGYPLAKQRLMDSGMSPDAVERMPVGQVLLVDAAREYRRIADELEKWWNVPYADAKRHKGRTSAALHEENFSFGSRIANMLLPVINSSRNAEARTQWQMNVLLVIEALRMHVAVEGEFPETLDQIKVVPVPDNPLTGNPYAYRLEDGMAVVELPFSDGMPGIAWRFEIKLAEETKAS